MKTQNTYHTQTGTFIGAIAKNISGIPDETMQAWIENPKALQKFLKGLSNPPVVVLPEFTPFVALLPNRGNSRQYNAYELRQQGNLKEIFSSILKNYAPLCLLTVNKNQDSEKLAKTFVRTFSYLFPSNKTTVFPVRILGVPQNISIRFAQVVDGSPTQTTLLTSNFYFQVSDNFRFLAVKPV